MADRYWRGGTGTWNSTNTANWSATSGGAGGASVPTSGDNVFFNNASTAANYTVTIGSDVDCANINIAKPTSYTVTFSGSSFYINVYGTSFTITGTISASSGPRWNLRSATTMAVSTNNQALNQVYVLSGTVTCGTAFFAAQFLFQGGTWNTGNFAQTWTTFNATGTNARTLNLGSSAITSSSVTMGTDANLTLNAGTSSWTVTYNGDATLQTNNKTFYNLTIGATFASSSYTITFSGDLNCQNLTFVAGTAIQGRIFGFTGNVNVTSTITYNGAADETAGRKIFMSYAPSGVTTITAAAKASLQNCDFQNITIAGAQGTYSGTGIGSGGGNTNITASAARTLYYTAAGDLFNTGWALTQGTTGTLCPRPQDTCVFYSDTVPASGATVSPTRMMIGNCTATARTTPVSWNQFGCVFSGTNYQFGSGCYIYGGTVNFQPAYNATMSLSITGTQFVATDIRFFEKVPATLSLASNITFGGYKFYQGTLTLNNYQLTNTTASAVFTGTLAKTINWGTSGVLRSTYGSQTTFDGWATGQYFTHTGDGTLFHDYTTTSGFTYTISMGNTSMFNGKPPKIKLGAGVALNFNVQFGHIGGFEAVSGCTANINLAYTKIVGNVTAVSTIGSLTGAAQFYPDGTGNYYTLITAGKTSGFSCNLVGAKLQLGDAADFGSAVGGVSIDCSVAGGAFKTNGYAYSGYYFSTSGTGNAATFDVTNSSVTLYYDPSFPTIPTLISTGATFILASTSTKNFNTYGLNWNNITVNTGTVSFSGGGTINNLTGVAAGMTFTFANGTTTTINGTMSLGGTAGSKATLKSDSASVNATLTKPSGTIDLTNTTVTRMTGAGGATWNALLTNGNVDGGNNVNWVFALATGSHRFFAFF